MARDAEKLLEQGERIRELRKFARVSQETAANAIGVTLRGYQRWERGEGEISVDNLHRLAAYYSTTPDFIQYGVMQRPRGDTPDLSQDGGPQLDRIEEQYGRILHELQELKQRVDDRVEMLDTIVRERQETERRLRHMTVDEADEIIRLLQESRNRLGRDVGKRSLRAEPDKDRRAAQ